MINIGITDWQVMPIHFLAFYEYNERFGFAFNCLFQSQFSGKLFSLTLKWFYFYCDLRAKLLIKKAAFIFNCHLL